MATYQQIEWNTGWFRAQIDAMDKAESDCQGLSFDIGCMHLDEGEWPEALQDFKKKYDESVEIIADDEEVGYAGGEKALDAISSTLLSTARAYIRAEAAAEETISSQILTLLDKF